MRRHRHSQLGNSEYLQKIILFFLIGFFVGAVFYYFFQHSFEGIRKQLEDNLALWSQEGKDGSSMFVKSFWQHGKYLLLFGVFSLSVLKGVYPKVFVCYTGLRNGFLLLFFLYAKGAFGFVIYFVSLFPQALLFVPLYLSLFRIVKENRQDKHKLTRWFGIAFVFIAACLLEVKVNLPLMEALL